MLRRASVLGVFTVLWLTACRGLAPESVGGFRLPSEGRVVDLTRPSSSEGSLRTMLVCPGRGVESTGPGRWVAPLILLDRTAVVSVEPADDLRIEELIEFESKNGPIPRGSMVLVRTGRHGAAAQERATIHPGVQRAALDFLFQTRGCVGVGTDFESLEPEPDQDLAQRALEEHSAFAVVGLGPLDQIPATGGIGIVAPVPGAIGESAPVRFLALVPRWGSSRGARR